MKLMTKAAAMALATCTIAAAQPSDANAARTLLDLLRGNTGSEKTSSRDGRETVDVDPEPISRVSSPRYYTYKADSFRALNIPAFVEPMVTGSVSNDSATPEAASLPIIVKTDGDIAKVMEAYYQSEADYLWIEGDAVLDRAKAAMDQLAKADEVGLDPQDYAVEMPDLTGDAVQRRQQLATFEFKLTAAALMYIQDNQRGRIDPNRISGYHDFKRKSVDLATDIKILKNAARVDRYLAYRVPKSKHFEELVAELARLKQEMGDPDDRVEIADGTLIKPGRSSDQLQNVVKGIVKNASDDLKLEHALTLADYKQTDEYSQPLVELVEAFQKEKGLHPDGVVGPATIRKLVGGDSIQDRYNKVVYAMERARWLPNELGDRRVFINEPAYQAYYFQDGKEQLSMRVVIGKTSNQTYFFQDEIETVEFNPYWGVPRSIIVNEMLPKLRQDPSYLDRLGYEVSYQGRRVSSTSVDWYKTASVDVRQPPGNSNALGELKILFPNSHAIYMHDTPSKSFFKRDVRALSHGCVRLADPRAMASAVLGVGEGEIARQIADGQNKQVNVPHKIPVYVAYFTAWPDKDGKVEYFEDVYKRDEYLQRAIDATDKERHSNV
ncbi:murein L,D-transpeptidase [Rhizobium sp. L1K21]|uniref:L,D-transpeptidase family protein n=1 Tax=Rhizobium sp. L1K21 TaxID=2954933 RepID=UPI0020922CA3|nr:L,D-transpeptidase family protein [Rhizobium sp. L1K21]MCO6186332.1 L,D-transpeptidase family protein [Rhizobium sp. L1K21]